VLLEACPGLTIVGGQAVNVWAIAYLDPEHTHPEGFGSHDMDVLARMKVAEIIAALPGWKSEKPPMWSFDRRLLRMTSRADDGRLLVVEVLGKVLGLDNEDLEAVVEIENDGMTYRVLDPVAMLRAKAANVREIPQDGPPPRQDRAHLKLIAQCIAPFLRDTHQQALGNPELHAEFAKTISRAFKSLFDRAILRTLLSDGIQPLDLLPSELKDSSIEKVRTAFEHQMPRLVELIAKSQAK
jgi:AcrR family transcriptional regulator